MYRRRSRQNQLQMCMNKWWLGEYCAWRMWCVNNTWWMCVFVGLMLCFSYGIRPILLIWWPICCWPLLEKCSMNSVWFHMIQQSRIIKFIINDTIWACVGGCDANIPCPSITSPNTRAQYKTLYNILHGRIVVPSPRGLLFHPSEDEIWYP